MLGQELEYRTGRDPDAKVALRVRWYAPDIPEPLIEVFLGEGAEPATGTLPAGWARVTVQTSSRDGLRMFELEPAEPGSQGGGKELQHFGFYLKGHFAIARKVNNTREAEQYAAPVDPVYTLDQALKIIEMNPRRFMINIRHTDPPLPWPWVQRMRLKGAWLYVHPENERAAIAFLERQRGR